MAELFLCHFVHLGMRSFLAFSEGTMSAADNLATVWQTLTACLLVLMPIFLSVTLMGLLCLCHIQDMKSIIPLMSKPIAAALSLYLKLKSLKSVKGDWNVIQPTVVPPLLGTSLWYGKCNMDKSRPCWWSFFLIILHHWMVKSIHILFRLENDLANPLRLSTSNSCLVISQCFVELMFVIKYEQFFMHCL